MLRRKLIITSGRTSSSTQLINRRMSETPSAFALVAPVTNDDILAKGFAQDDSIFSTFLSSTSTLLPPKQNVESSTNSCLAQDVSDYSQEAGSDLNGTNLRNSA